jgi:hypothetical protein
MRNVRTLATTLLASLLTVSAASAGQLWTTAGSSGAIDPADLSITGSTAHGCFGYASGSTSTSTITIRYNVTLDDTTAPTWKTLEILANNANVTNGVTATLYQVSRTNGATSLVSTVTSLANAGTQEYTESIGTSVTFDFTSYYYVIEADIFRTVDTAVPELCGVRLY